MQVNIEQYRFGERMFLNSLNPSLSISKKFMSYNPILSQSLSICASLVDFSMKYGTCLSEAYFKLMPSCSLKWVLLSQYIVQTWYWRHMVCPVGVEDLHLFQRGTVLVLSSSRRCYLDHLYCNYVWCDNNVQKIEN